MLQRHNDCYYGVIQIKKKLWVKLVEINEWPPILGWYEREPSTIEMAERKMKTQTDTYQGQRAML